MVNISWTKVADINSIFFKEHFFSLLLGVICSSFGSN